MFNGVDISLFSFSFFFTYSEKTPLAVAVGGFWMSSLATNLENKWQINLENRNPCFRNYHFGRKKN